MSGRQTADIAHLIVVPAVAGSLLPLAQVDGTRSDVDEVLDDLFGEVDDDGPALTDAVLLTGGTLAVAASQVAALPAIVLVGGLAALGLGLVLPIRSGLRHLRGNRRTAKIKSLIGNGYLLDTRSTVVTELVATHQQAIVAANELSELQQLRVRNVAHGLVTEVAMLLDGSGPASETESHYVTERIDALRVVLATLAELSTDDGGPDRRANVEARIQLDAESTLSAIDEAESLAEDLLSGRDR